MKNLRYRNPMQIELIEIDKIWKDTRFRQDLGDIDALAQNIDKRGLLHPIVVVYSDEEGYRLIAGARRIAAYRQLGRAFIEATIIALDASDYRAVESEENTYRKPFTPTEMYEVSRAMMERETELAQERSRAGKRAEPEPPDTVSRGKQAKGRVKDVVASRVGTSRANLRKIEVVMEAAAAEPGEYEDVVETMNESGNVAGAVREVKKRQRKERIEEQSEKVRAAKTVTHNHKLYKADNFAMVEDGSVDLVCTDPPYNLSVDRVIDFPGEDRSSMSNNFGEWDWLPDAEFIELLDKWSAGFYRVLRPGGSVIALTSEAYVSFFRKSLVSAGFRFKNTLVWARPNPKPKPDKTSYVAACDFILFAVKGEGHTFNYTKHNEMLSLINTPSANGTERAEWGHPTQKPLKLIEKLIRVSSNPGDTILDPFAGSGTTGKACQQLGRRFILVESDPEYIQMIEARTEVKGEYVEPLPKVY